MSRWMADYDLKILEYFDDGGHIKFVAKPNQDHIEMSSLRDTNCIWPDKEWASNWCFSRREADALRDFLNYFMPPQLAMSEVVQMRLPGATYVDSMWDIATYEYLGHRLELSYFDCEGNAGTGAKAWNADIDKFLKRIIKDVS